ncbi:hypothetical protein DFJ73DRAFT_966891 [Zopfochytrium polystomum]|nr:hypothetical protein DFJ73DRAFT_966891 [Zopfochytrium polystomum]
MRVRARLKTRAAADKDCMSSDVPAAMRALGLGADIWTWCTSQLWCGMSREERAEAVRGANHWGLSGEGIGGFTAAARASQTILPSFGQDRRRFLTTLRNLQWGSSPRQADHRVKSKRKKKIENSVITPGPGKKSTHFEFHRPTALLLFIDSNDKLLNGRIGLRDELISGRSSGSRRSPEAGCFGDRHELLEGFQSLGFLVDAAVVAAAVVAVAAAAAAVLAAVLAAEVVAVAVRAELNRVGDGKAGGNGGQGGGREVKGRENELSWKEETTHAEIKKLKRRWGWPLIVARLTRRLFRMPKEQLVGVVSASPRGWRWTPGRRGPRWQTRGQGSAFGAGSNVTVLLIRVLRPTAKVLRPLHFFVLFAGKKDGEWARRLEYRLGSKLNRPTGRKNFGFGRRRKAETAQRLGDGPASAVGRMSIIAALSGATIPCTHKWRSHGAARSGGIAAFSTAQGTRDASTRRRRHGSTKAWRRSKGGRRSGSMRRGPGFDERSRGQLGRLSDAATAATALICDYEK